jgi:cytoskeletal protein CcmA (bactofilin family)
MARTILTIIFIVSIFTGCSRDSDVASKNISKQSDMFQIQRRIIFLNGITDNYIMTITGKCSIKKDNTDNQLEVICKTGDSSYKKHYLGLSNNITYFVEQMESKNVSAYHYEVVFKPQVIIPDIDFRGNVKSVKDVIIPDSKDKVYTRDIFNSDS